MRGTNLSDLANAARSFSLLVMTLDHLLNPEDTLTARDRIVPYIRRTPVMTVELAGRPLVLKLEYLQLSGSFKLRGALNALLAAGKPSKVIAASGGNHGLGVATAAQILGIEATIIVPETAPASKARRILDRGARLVHFGESFADAAEYAKKEAAATGAPLIHPYNDAAVVAGQGTITVEIIEDEPQIDTIVVAGGGGGLAAGTALAAQGRLTVVSEPDHCDSVYQALQVGHPVDADVTSVASSALGTARAGEIPLAVLLAHPVLSLRVPDSAIIAARDALWENFRIAAEPAAAAPLAAWLTGEVPGDLACLVICGANADWAPLD